MANRPSRLVVGIPTASYDGRYHGRYPHGDKPGGGAVADGDVIVRTGPSASVPSVKDWLGGASGPIESGSNGAHFTRSNWSQLFTTLSDWQYSNARPLSRSKTLRYDTDVANDGRGTYFFDHGASGAAEEYFSCNYYCDTGVASVMQWKIKRLMATAGTTDTEVPSWYTAKWLGGLGAFVNQWATGRTPNTNDIGTEYPLNAWFRFESWTVASNPAGTANGSIRIKVTLLSTGATVFDFTALSGIITRGTGDPVYRYHCMQNYLGNEVPTSTRMVVDMEDIYIASVPSGSGAFVRAELCNNSVYSSATIKRLCDVQSIAGTDWSVALNGSSSVFGTSDLSGLYLALHPANGGAPTMALV